MTFDTFEENKINNINEDRFFEVEKLMALYGHEECSKNFVGTKEFEKLSIELIKNPMKYRYSFNLEPLTTRYMNELVILIEEYLIWRKIMMLGIMILLPNLGNMMKMLMNL